MTQRILTFISALEAIAPSSRDDTHTHTHTHATRCAVLCEVLKDKQLEVPAFTFKSNSLFLHNLTDFIRQVLVQSPSSRARSKRVMSESDETMFDVLDTSRDVLDTSRES